MSSSAHIALLSRQEVEKLSREHVHLKTGDKLEGKVVRLKNDGKVSIDFEKFQAEVELKVPVEKGDVVTVEVMEKGKQIKLKLLDVQSKSGQVNAEPPQEGRQVDPDGGNEGRLIRSKIQQLLKDDIQQPTGANKNKFTNDSDRAASQLKDSLVKLRDILKNTGKTGTTDLKNLSGEIKAILSSLENSGEALNLGEKILEPASQLHAAVKAGATARGEALPKEVTQILSNISKAVDKIGNLGNLEQLPEIKQILRDELKPNVLRLKEILDTGTSGGRQSAGPTSEADIKQSVDQLLKNIDNALERLPDKVDTPGRNAANTPRVERAPAQSATASRSHPPEVRQVTEQITDLKNLVEKAGLSDNKDVVEIVKRLTEAASKIDNFKGPDKLAEIKTIIAKEIKPEVLKLKEVVGRDLPRIETAGRPVVTSAVPDVGRATDDLMRSLEQALDKLPGKIKPESSGVQSSANRTSNAAGDSRPPEVRKVTEQITDLKNLVEKAGLSDNKDVSEIVKRLTEAASKIDRLKGPDQLAELKTILDKEVKSDLLQLKETVTREMFRLKPVERRPARDVTLALNDVLRNLDKAVDKLPDRADIVRSSAPAPARETSNTQAPETAASAVSRDTGRAENIPADTIRADTQRIMEQVADLKQLVETADFPLDKETTEVMDRLSKAAENIARLQTPQQAPEARQILQNELKPDLQLLKEIMGKKAASMNLTPQQSLKRIDTNISKLLGDIQTVLEKLPEPVKASQEIDTLLNEIKNIRRTMENRVDGMEAGDRVASRVSDLKAVMENAGIPFDKDMEAIAAKLAEAVDKISNLKNPDQLAEIKHIIENEIKPNVAALKHIVDQGASARGAPSTQADAAQNDALQRLMRADPGAASEIKERVEDLQKEIESALQKMPDREQADKDNHNLLEEIESALGKIADFSHFNSGQDEEIEMLFENIKLALKQLRFNIQSQSAQSGESPFSIPPDFSEKIANLQLNLQAGSFNIEEAVTQQIATLNSLIQLIEDSGFAIDKRVEALLAKLTDIADHLSQYKSNGQWQKAVDMVEKQLKPALQSSRELFGGWRGSDSSVIGETASALETAVQSFESQVTGMLEKVADQQQMQTLDINQKTAHLPQAVKGVLENLPAGMQSVENISQLSEVITEVLDKNPDFLTSMDGSSSMPSEVKDMLSSLRSHFKPIDIGEGALKLAPKLKAVVEDSGIFFEKKVGEAVSRLTEASDRLAGIKSMGRLPEIRDIIANDLKPNLLALQEYLETEHLVTDPAQREALETIKEAVDDLVKNIHSQQDRAVDTQNQQQQPYQMFSFSIPIKGEEEAKLKVFYNKKGKKGGEGEFKLSMLLDMDKMGEVRTDFFHTKKNLAVTFYVKDEEIKEYLEESFHEVAEMVEEDYESVAMSVAVSSDKIAEFETEASPPEEIISDKAVDVKV